MLDELLGRAELKSRVAELEEERDSLAAQLEAEQERRAEAASARQEAERRCNRLEDRITELEDRVERLSEDDGDAPEYSFRGVEQLRGDRLAAVLDRLASVDAPGEGALTAMVADGVPDALDDAPGVPAPLVERAAPALVCADDAGVVRVALRSPVAPAPFAQWDDEFALSREWFLPSAQGRHALALVRADLFALGVYEGGERVSFRGFETDVKGSHSKGGFSQARFERRRDEQVEAHLDDVREALAEAPDPLFVVGESTLLGEFEERAAVTAPADATGSPEDALAAARADFWTAQCYLL